MNQSPLFPGFRLFINCAGRGFVNFMNFSEDGIVICHGRVCAWVILTEVLAGTFPHGSLQVNWKWVYFPLKKQRPWMPVSRIQTEEAYSWILARSVQHDSFIKLALSVWLFLLSLIGDPCVRCQLWLVLCPNRDEDLVKFGDGVVFYRPRFISSFGWWFVGLARRCQC